MQIYLHTNTSSCARALGRPNLPTHTHSHINSFYIKWINSAYAVLLPTHFSLFSGHFCVFYANYEHSCQRNNPPKCPAQRFVCYISRPRNTHSPPRNTHPLQRKIGHDTPRGYFRRSSTKRPPPFGDKMRRRMQFHAELVLFWPKVRRQTTRIRAPYHYANQLFKLLLRMRM